MFHEIAKHIEIDCLFIREKKQLKDGAPYSCEYKTTYCRVTQKALDETALDETYEKCFNCLGKIRSLHVILESWIVKFITTPTINNRLDTCTIGFLSANNELDLS